MEDDKVVSIVERLRKKKEADRVNANYEGEYPIFEGKVLSVSGQVFEGGETYSAVNYLPAGVEEPEVNAGELLLSGEAATKFQKDLEAKVHRAIVPMPLHPELLRMAEVRAYLDDMGQNGHSVPTYVLEIIKGPSRAADVFSMMAEMQDGTPDTGFKYIKVLK